jgi:hypothetical protein
LVGDCMAGGGCPGPDPTIGSASICQNIPNAFGTFGTTSACDAGVQIFAR